MARGPTVAVVDASVVVKWFKNEDHTERAIALRDDWVRGRVALHSVELMPYEVLNALRYNPDQTAESLRRAAVNLCDYPFSFMPIADIAEMTIENALRYGISVYDASYISAGEALGAPVYTADERLITRIGGDILRGIADYPTPD